MSPALRVEALLRVVDDAESLVRRAAGSSLSVRAKPDGSPVTALDREVDRFLRDALLRLIPEAGWLSEETPDDLARLERELTWIVDPIDGTKELVAGRDEVAVSIGLVRHGRVVAAAVANPLRSERGVWVEGDDPLFEGLPPRPDPASLEATEAIVSRTEQGAGDLDGLHGLVGKTRVVGSVAYKLLRVASRADDLTFSVRPKQEWDVCGGIGLVLAAGRDVVRLDHDAIAFNRPDPRIPVGAVAGPRPLARELARALRRRMEGPGPSR